MLPSEALSSYSKLTTYLSSAQAEREILSCNVQSHTPARALFTETLEPAAATCGAIACLTLAQCTACAQSDSWRTYWLCAKKHFEWRFLTIEQRTRFGEDYLCSARNMPQLRAHDCYLSQPIPTDALLDPKICALIPPETEQMGFDHNETGLCEGMCDWFIRLYYATQDAFFSTERHLIAIARQFQEGGPRQAILMQCLNVIKDPPLLGASCSLQRIFCEGLSDAQRQARVASKITALSEGAHGLDLWQPPQSGGHRLNFFKCNDNLGYVFDPNAGLIRFRGADMAQRVARFMLHETSVRQVNIVLLLRFKPLKKPLRWPAVSRQNPAELLSF
jgi:hypothetical protein